MRLDRKEERKGNKIKSIIQSYQPHIALCVEYEYIEKEDSRYVLYVII